MRTLENIMTILFPIPPFCTKYYDMMIAGSGWFDLALFSVLKIACFIRSIDGQLAHLKLSFTQPL